MLNELASGFAELLLNRKRMTCKIVSVDVRNDRVAVLPYGKGIAHRGDFVHPLFIPLSAFGYFPPLDYHVVIEYDASEFKDNAFTPNAGIKVLKVFE